MQKSIKQYASYILGAATLFVMIALFMCLPHSAFAATGTLGTESPEIYCTYKDADGKEVDGNKLEAGTYEVSFNIKNMTSAAVLQITASYNGEVTVDSSSVIELSDIDTNFSSMGYLTDDGNIVFGYVSNADDTSPLTAEGTSLFTIDMTFANSCDAADVITVSTDPNLTFATADYGDGYDDEYALDISEATSYTGTRYLMTCDVTPSLGRTVSGNVVMMTDTDGSSNGTSAYGEYTVNVYSDADRTDLVTTAVTDNTVGNNKFVIENLTAGTYYATISAQYAIPRDVTIIVADSDIDAGSIPMICCEFDNDGYVTTNDAKFIFESSLKGNNIEYCDFDGDGYVTTNDAKIVFKLSLSSNYQELTLK